MSNNIASGSKDLSFKLLEAYSKDVGRGVARIDYDSMDSLSASTGDVIEIRGKRRTVAKCLPLYPSDEGKGIIRIDDLVRNNAGVAKEDTVVVRKIKAAPAEKVIVAPLEAIPPIDERYLADALESVPLVKGDNVMVSYFGGTLTFQVIGVTPAADAVLVTQKTIFRIAEKSGTVKGVPQVTYEDIGGLKEEIQKVREMIELPLSHPEIFEKIGIEAPKSVLIYGPIGTGKTLLAKAIISESIAYFISISGPEIMSKFRDESEARLREIFKEAKEKAPSMIFIDEIDSIAPKREVSGEVERKVVSQLLSLIDGLEARGKVIVIAATNRPNAIDPALRRPCRFDREIEIRVPDKRGRLEILQIHTRNMPLDTDVDQDRIAAVTHGFVGADLEYLCKEAAMKCLRRLLPELNLEDKKLAPEALNKLVVTMSDFKNAVKETRKRFELVEKDKALRSYSPTIVEDTKVLMEENKTLAQRFHMDILQKGDLSVADKILVPEFVWRNPSFPSELSYGQEGAKKIASQIIESIPDRKITYEDIIAEGDKVLIRWTITGTPKAKFLNILPSDKQITLIGFDLFRISNGKIMEIWQQYIFGRWQ